MKQVRRGGGWPAVFYTLRKAREVGGFLKLWRAMRTRNACKTCALGMGGQKGGMVNEQGHFPEVCKKSLQAMAADMQGAIRPDFFSTYSVAQLERFTPRELEACGRLTTPLILRRGDEYYRPLDWSDALGRLAAKLREIKPSESFWYFSGRSSNEAGFLLQLFARLYGTNNVNNCSFYCHQASGVGLVSAIGSGTATVTLEDVEHADLVFIIGGNPASNHPRLMRTLMGVRRSGGDVIVVNPIVETGLVNFAVPSDMRSLFFGTKIASIYVQPHIGGDLALLTGIAKRTLELGAADAPYLAAHADGWPEWKTHLENLDWQEIYRRSGVAAAEIDAMARRYAAAKRAVFGWTMGITHHVHGVENVQAIVNLALLRGMVGRPGAGLMPIRGHSNVQGIGSVGVTPKLKEEIFTRLQQHFGIALPRDPGLDTMGSIEAAAEGRLKVGVCLGGNLYGSNPDAAFAHSALGKLDLLVYMNTTLNTGHAHGPAAETIILPVLARDEEPQPTTQESMFNYVRLSDGGPARHIGPRSEVQIVADLAHRVLGEVGPVDWRVMADTGQIRQAMSQIIPGWEKIHDIDRTREEFHITGRTFREPTFSTPSGKARLHVVALPDLAGAEGELRLMTIRSEGQFNTVVYEEYDLYRGQDRRDIILMHPEDATRLGLRADQRVTITSEVGSMSGILVRPFDRIKQGNAAMYYPEANVLVPRHLDPASRTPAFKNVLVRIEPDSAAGRRQPVAAEDVPAERVDPAMLVGSAGPENMRAC